MIPVTLGLGNRHLVSQKNERLKENAIGEVVNSDTKGVARRQHGDGIGVKSHMHCTKISRRANEILRTTKQSSEDGSCRWARLPGTR